MNSGLHIGGSWLFIGASSYGLTRVGVSLEWVGVVAVALLGVGVMVAVSKTDPGEQEVDQAS